MSAVLDLPVEKLSPTETLVLANGERMSRREFHRLYERSPESVRAELIGGVVHMPSPLRRQHGTYHVLWSMLFGFYMMQTRGVEAGDNASLLLSDESEPQPDLYLRVLPEFGGRSTTTDDDYVAGPPELIVEIALSSRSVDLFGKRADYHRYGVREYFVFVPRQQLLYWFDLTKNEERPIPADGIVRSSEFPGLWLNAPAILQQDQTAAMATLQQGLATDEHRQFVERLSQRVGQAPA